MGELNWWINLFEVSGVVFFVYLLYWRVKNFLIWKIIDELFKLLFKLINVWVFLVLGNSWRLSEYV